jgi:PAS domain S-box-containing protein
VAKRRPDPARDTPEGGVRPPGAEAPDPAARLCDLARELLAVADPAARLVRVNASFSRVLGRPEGETLGRPWLSLVRPADRERAGEALAAARASGRAQACQTVCPHADGSERWIAWRVAAAGGTGEVLLAGEDVTARMEARRRLSESEGLFGLLVENVRDVFWVTEPGPTPIRYVSPAYERVFGRPREEYYGDPDAWRRAIHPDDLERVLAAVRRSEEAGAYDELYRIVRPDGGVRWIRDRAFPVRDAAGRIARIFGLAEDVTALREAEEDLRRTRERLAEGERLEALGRLAGGVAHDFNNLLTVILGYTSLLLDRVPAGDPSRKALETVALTGDRAADLTRQLLAFSRRQTLAPRVLDLGRAVAEVLPMLRRVVGEDVRISVVGPTEGARVRADPSQVAQVLVNLAANARDAMPGGGRLTIAIDPASTPTEDAVGCGVAPAGAFVRLSVSDTGVGMDEATRARVFEPFFTTKAAGKGTGLGLATVYGILAQSGGCVSVESAPGRGTTFHAWFPRAEGAPAVEPADAPAASLPRGTETVLVLEDEEALVSWVREVLEAQGYRVLAARDAPAAARLLAAAPRLDLLLTDVVLPGGGVRSLVEHARRRRPDLEVLYMSGHDRASRTSHGVAAEEDALLEKPFRREALLERVRAVLDARRGGG